MTPEGIRLILSEAEKEHGIEEIEISVDPNTAVPSPRRKGRPPLKSKQLKGRETVQSETGGVLRGQNTTSASNTTRDELQENRRPIVTHSGRHVKRIEDRFDNQCYDFKGYRV